MKHKIAIERLKKDARFTIGMDLEQVNHLVQQVQPIAAAIEHLVAERQRIRADSRLSNAGKADDIQRATDGAVDKIAQHAAKISRAAIVNDLAQRLSTKVTGARTKAKAEMQDGPLLAQELRQAVLPRLLKDGENMRIPAGQTVAKLALRAAESYADNPGKAELIVNALSVGWPWCPDLPEGTVDQINNTIAAQVAPTEQTALQEAKGVQALFDHVVNESLQEIKELG